jgi:hypothetical protein
MTPRDYKLYLTWSQKLAVALTTPHRITVTPVGQVEFVSVLRRQSVVPSDIVSIITKGTAFSFSPFGNFALLHRNGKVRFLGQFTGLHSLLGEIRQVNPNIEMLGC